jgi:disulfide bond formation protein DsbB
MLTRRSATSLALLGSLAVIGGALFSQYVGGLTPCELCLLERWPYYVAIPLLVIALARGARGSLALGLIVLVALLFLASSGLAFYHVGVEQHWFAGPTACTGTGGTAHTVEELKAQLMNQQPVRCDEVPWSLFHISLAGWNLVASLVLAALSLYALQARSRKRGRIA